MAPSAKVSAAIAAIEDDPTRAFETLKTPEIVAVLKAAADAYYNTDKAIMTDDLFDLIKSHLQQVAPKHPYLREIGAAVVAERAKAKLPYWMGSLDKIRDDPTAVQKWAATYEGTYIVSDKLDGNSALFVIAANGTRALYSRGDGKVGQDISHLLPLIRGIPERLGAAATTPLAVRGELIISRDDWAPIAHLGANARNMVAGVMHSKHPDARVAAAVRFVAYELLSPPARPLEQSLDFLASQGFEVVHHVKLAADALTTDNLSENLMRRRRESPFEIDGIVVFHNAVHKLANGANPKYAFAFKSILTHDEAEVIISKVEWNVSKDGYIKPILHFVEPVTLAGASISKATGINAAFIERHILGPGARAVIIRSGDVIPKVQRVLSPAANGKPSLPTDLSYTWTDTHVDIVIDANTNAPAADQVLRQMEHFVTTLEMKGIASGTLKRLYEAGIDTIPKLVKVTETQLLLVEGIQKTTAKKIVEAVAKVHTAPCADLMVASNIFGRGLGKRKIAAIVAVVPVPTLLAAQAPAVTDIAAVDGIGPATAAAFVKALPAFKAFIASIGVTCAAPAPSSAASASASASAAAPAPKLEMTIVFTGFRDKDWETSLIAAGAKIGSSISKNTDLVVAAPSAIGTAKLVKAQQLGVRAISKEEFVTEFGRFL